MIKIEKATEKDLEIVYALICILGEGTLDKDSFSRIYQEGLENKYLHYLVAKDEDMAIGFLSLTTAPLLHHAANIAEIIELVMDNTHRGKGIGSLLFEAAKQIAIDTNCQQLELSTNMLRKRAHKFYESKGMNRFHYKYSMSLNGNAPKENKIGI